MIMSEVDQLRQQIELQCQAMQRGLTGYAGVAKHEMIRHKYDQIESIKTQLGNLVGKEAATIIVCEAYIKLAETEE